MSEINSLNSNHPVERQLAERLRGDADHLEQPFSESLHARIMSATIAAEPSVSIKRPEKTGSSRRRPALWWTALAAGLLIVALGAWRLEQTTWPSGGQRSSTEAALIVQHDAGSSDAYSLDDLNHGAGLALRLVVDQLPMDVPADDWGLPSVHH
jgi:hypothetical protein